MASEQNIRMYQFMNVGVSLQEDADTLLYGYENVGVDPAPMGSTDGATNYHYMNVGVNPADNTVIGDSRQYQYEYVLARPVGSKETMPPTHN